MCRGERVSKLEEYALDLLDKDLCTDQTIEELIKRIPLGRKSALRDVLRPNGKQAGAITFGLFAHGLMMGVTKASQEMPNVCRCVNRWVASFVPENYTWSSITIGVQTAAEMHIDAHNDGNSLNMSLTLGRFSKGELWLRADRDQMPKGKKTVWRTRKGQQLPGYHVDTFHKPFFFSPKQYHATCEWSGFRISVTTFTARSIVRLGNQDSMQLESLGFRVPSISDSPRHFVMSGVEEESGNEQECIRDLETVLDPKAVIPRPRAAGMFKRMLDRAAVWLSNSNSAIAPRHVQPARASGEDGSPGSRRPRRGTTHGHEEVYGGMAETDDDSGHLVVDGAQSDGGGPLDAARPGGPAPGGDDPEDPHQQGDEEEPRSFGPRHRRSAEEVHGAQGVSHEGARMQPSSGCSTMPREPSGTMVGVHAVRFSLGPSPGEPNDDIGDNKALAGGREGPEADQHPWPRVPEVSTGASGTASTRSTPGDIVAERSTCDHQGRKGQRQHWSYAFFHGNTRRLESETDSPWTSSGASGENPDSCRRPRDLRAEHGPRGLGRCGNGQPQRHRGERRAVIGGEGLRTCPTEEPQLLAGCLHARGWLLKSILVMITLVEASHPATTLGTMFGEPRDQLWWHRDERSWRPDPPEARPCVECRVFPREQVNKDWLADTEGMVVEMNQADRKRLASVWLKSTVSVDENNSTPNLLRRAKVAGAQLVMALDLTAGWEFHRAGDRNEAKRLMRDHAPAMIMVSLQEKGPTAFASNLFVGDLVLEQLAHGRGFLMECPCSTSTMTTPTMRTLRERSEIFSVILDFNRLGIGDGTQGMVIQPVIALTNVPELFRTVRRRFSQLPNLPVHAGDSEQNKIGVYIKAFGSVLSQGLRRHLRTKHVPVTHARDRWAWQAGHLECRHFFPRQLFCLPEECPFDVSRVKFTGRRVTRMDPVGGQAKWVEDEWPAQRARSTAFLWTGATLFPVVPEMILPDELTKVADQLAKSAAHDFHVFQTEQHALQAEAFVFQSEPHALPSENAVFQSEPHALPLENAVFQSEPHALPSENTVFQSEPHALPYASRVTPSRVFPSHRILEGRQSSSASASARPSADVQSTDFDWEDFFDDVENEESRFLTGGVPFARNEAVDTKETATKATEEEARVARELREIVVDPSMVEPAGRTVVAPDVRREVYYAGRAGYGLISPVIITYRYVFS